MDDQAAIHFHDRPNLYLHDVAAVFERQSVSLIGGPNLKGGTRHLPVRESFPLGVRV